MQITLFTNANNWNLLQAAANATKHYGFHCILLVSILYSLVENLYICYQIFHVFLKFQKTGLDTFETTAGKPGFVHTDCVWVS